jgi:AraC-like DNA-binding protein
MTDTLLISSIQTLITKRLHSHYPTIDHTARLLGIPVRTLQRRLQGNGLSYSQLVEQTRFELSCYLLDTPDMQMAEITRALGYADPGSFSRAFRRWTSMSPREYRHRLHSEKAEKG